MNVGFHASGIFPRSEKLIQATRDFAHKRCSKEDVRKAFEADARELVEMQRKEGFSFITDGMLLWDDIFRPFSESLGGVKAGGVTRYFENNTFFRQPVITGRLALNGPFIQKYLFKEWVKGDFPKIINLPGPYTFSVLSEDSYYHDRQKLMQEFSVILNAVAKELEKLGINYIRFSEPALAYAETRPGENRRKGIIENYRMMFDGVKAGTSLNLFFGDITHIIDFIPELPFSGLDIDFTETSIRNLGISLKSVSLGCIDSRSSFLEDPENIARQARAFAESVNPERLYLTPNCDLEFLPYSIAAKKMSILKEAARLLANP
ncbi:MAG: hypothetical protein HYX24_02940 [Candidatus Aenigmarchaeota archaeon]|nr:hypothetical protein [Candidatus Aenigmarchaeota archaeon]